MILSLLSTNAISLFFRDFAAKHPEYTLLQCAGESPARSPDPVCC